jgi:3-methyladenine DNA glycosylase AlkD
MEILEIISKLKSLADPQIANQSQRYFKTAPGEYAEGDIFLGIRAPKLRQLAKEYKTIKITQAEELLQSEFHEQRTLALLILCLIFTKAEETDRKKIYNLYLNNTKLINNWDLVDCSAEHIVGKFLFSKDKSPLYKLSSSKDLWERRISIISTFYFIKNKEFADTLKIAEGLLKDKEDLIHKAVGWMLREVGKRDLEVEKNFLAQYYKNMPRTMLRYAIEKFPEDIRQQYLKGTI